MNNNESANRTSTLSACALAVAFLFMTAAASAQTANAGVGQGGTIPSHASTVTGVASAGPISPQQPAQDAAAEEEQEALNLPHQVGDATLSLLAWQRSGDIASKTTRPIAGDVAQRSYERYLKSFEYPIPEHMSSTVKTTTGGGK